MKLLEEKGLRNKIINECIKYEHELYKMAKNFVEIADHTNNRISDLRMNLMQLLDNEKVE